MDTAVLGVISTLFILWLVFKVAMLKAELRGVEKTLEQMNNGSYDNGTEHGCITTLAIVGFLTVCGLCVYIGVIASAGAN